MSWLLEKEVTRDLPAEWNDVVPTEIFLKESQEVANAAQQEGLILRIIGGLGIALHSQEKRDFAKRLRRSGTGVAKGQEYSDLDFVAYRKQRARVKEFFAKMGYVKRKATLSSAASERQIYYHPKGWFTVDVFFDQLLVANHPIDLRDRLEFDFPTITVTDMLLEKIQMWEAFSQKDLKDCLLLIAAHEVEENSKVAIDSAYVAGILADDWGFWLTATTNLKNMKKIVSDLDKMGGEVDIAAERIKANEREEIEARINTILNRIEREPKSLGWKMRAKIGTKKKWYNPVERSDTVGGFGIWEAIMRKNA